MSERKPLPRGFHPAGLLVTSLAAVAFALVEGLLVRRPPDAYLLAASAVVPLYLVQLLLDHRHTEAAGLAFWAWAIRREVLKHRAGRRARRGLCPGCGYDLRASAGRCPECGRVAALKGNA